MQKRAGSWKSAMAKLALLLLSLAMTLGLLESILIPVVMQSSTLAMQGGFPEIMQILTQTSKREFVPRDYNLILGDSYAQGVGDWLASVDKSGNPPYSSAHVIHDRLDEDVVSFGLAGAGSVTGLVLLPERHFETFERLGIGPPRRILVYFYEGNDLNNNLRYLKSRYTRRYDTERVLQQAYLDDFLAAERQAYMASRRPLDRIFIVSYAARMAINAYRKYLYEEPPEPASSDPPNRVRVAGASVEIPPNLQSPSMDLNDSELRIALYVFGRGLAYLEDRFPDAEIHIVYIPSPIASYESLKGEVSVQSYESRGTMYRAQEVARKSRLLRRRVAEIATVHGARFFDVTPAVQRAARDELLHGPVDYNHFNEAGYRLLGREVSRHLNAR